jgi:hypothetical protein
MPKLIVMSEASSNAPPTNAVLPELPNFDGEKLGNSRSELTADVY